jgi:hypothetical protein
MEGQQVIPNWFELMKAVSRQNQTGFHALPGFIAAHGSGAHFHAANGTFG